MITRLWLRFDQAVHRHVTVVVLGVVAAVVMMSWQIRGALDSTSIDRQAIDDVNTSRTAHYVCLEARRNDYLQGEMTWFDAIAGAERLPLTSPERARIRRDAFDRRLTSLRVFMREQCSFNENPTPIPAHR